MDICKWGFVKVKCLNLNKIGQYSIYWLLGSQGLVTMAMTTQEFVDEVEEYGKGQIVVK